MKVNTLLNQPSHFITSNNIDIIEVALIRVQCAMYQVHISPHDATRKLGAGVEIDLLLL
jgi:hypothetical protein